MDKLQRYFIQALKLLIKHDNELIENQPKEECINHRLAQHMEEILRKNRELIHFKLNVDVEYDKYLEDQKKSSVGKHIRPDIIVHKRQSGDKHNLIVVEAKKQYVSGKDKKKIIDLVTSKRFMYSLGVGVAYLPGKTYMRISFFLPTKCWNHYHFIKNDFKLQETRR